MIFEDKQCNWETFCNQNILGPFAPRSSCAWDHSKINFSHRCSIKNGNDNQRFSNSLKCGLFKKLLKQDRQMQRFITKQNTLAFNAAKETMEFLESSNQCIRKGKGANRKKLTVIKLRKVSIFM